MNNSTLTSATSNDYDYDHETELKVRLETGVNMRNGGNGAGMLRLGGGDVKLRWDVNVHPWFPIPMVDNQMEVDS